MTAEQIEREIRISIKDYYQTYKPENPLNPKIKEGEVGIPLLQAEIIKSLFSEKGKKITLRAGIERYVRYLTSSEYKDLIDLSESEIKEKETMVRDLMEDLLQYYEV